MNTPVQAGRKPHLTSLLGLAISGFALVVYILTLSRGASPGESARLIAQHTGLDPFPPMSHLLWTQVVRLISVFPLGSIVTRLNLLSAFCGGVSVWLMYSIMVRVPHNRTAEETEARFPATPVQQITGAASALFLAFCVPFWFVSNRAHTASFDVLLLLLVTYLLIHFVRNQRIIWVYVFALLYGLGITEFETFIVLAPIYGVCLCFIMWRFGVLRPRTVSAVVCFFLLGLCLYFIAAWQYRQSPAYQWRSFSNVFQVIWFMWREEYRAIRFSLPQIGWLMVFMLTTLPWLVVIAAPKRAMTQSAVMGSRFLHGVLSLLGLLAMFNIPVAPWPLLGLRPLLVTPYVLTASWLGYLAGYWYIFFAQRSRFEAVSAIRLKTLGHMVYLPALAVLVLVSTVLNFRQVDGRAVAPLARFADQVVEDLHGRKWLLTNGQLDDLVAISAREKGTTLNILNLSQGLSDAYLRYASTLFDTPRLKGLARVGLAPLMNEWMTGTRGIEDQVAVLNNPDIWYTAGLTPVPSRVLFLGTTNMAAVAPDRLFSDCNEFWVKFGPSAKKWTRRDNAVGSWDQLVVSHVSKVANNVGVLLEDLNRSDLAFKAYQEARNLDTNNISALLNMFTLAEKESRPELPSLKEEFASMVRRLKVKLQIWALAYHSGYVRNAEALADRGWAWAMSGKPNLAVSEMQRAVSLGINKEQAQLAMASFYLMQQMESESEQIYLNLLKDNPKNINALFGLARVAERKGDFDTARSYLNRLKEIGAPASLVRLEEASCELLAGKRDDARRILGELVADDPKNMRGWSLLALVASDEKDEKTVERAVTVLKADPNPSAGALFSLAQIEIVQKNLDAARNDLDRIVAAQPSHKSALEWLLQIDLWQGNRDLAETHVERILQIDPKNAFANLVLGSIQYSRQEYELAEASYRASLATKRSSQALNDLAWILYLRNRYEDALRLSKEAVAFNKNDANSWDTLGVVSMQLGKLDDAQNALQQALTFQPKNAIYLLHMAQFYEKKGMKKESLRLADPLMVRPAEMPPDAFEELRALLKRVRVGA